MNEHSKERSTPDSLGIGPPAVWCRWPAVLERAARAHAKRQSRWRSLASRALTRWSARLEREPLRMFGLGAALAFAFGVLVGLL